MKDARGTTIYVGKAKNLKKRVSSYFRKQEDAKTIQLVSQIADIEITVAKNEAEALLLENSLICALKPKFNVVFRDDKSYPYIFISNHQSPQIGLHRGKKKKGYKYYGPYPSVRAVRETIEVLQQIFQLRDCSDTFFSNRKRPCLQYQIGRCSAPCVKKITKQKYMNDVKCAQLFLKGKTTEVMDMLVEQMELSAQALEFEKAMLIRNKIAELRKIHKEQSVYAANYKDSCDVVAIEELDDLACIHVLMVRSGTVVGSRQYIKEKELNSLENILTSFIAQQYYLDEAIYSSELASLIVDDEFLGLVKDINSLAAKSHKTELQIKSGTIECEKQWFSMAVASAREALIGKQNLHKNYNKKFVLLRSTLGIEKLNSIVCFDISHTMGQDTYASCVYYTDKGPAKDKFRRYKVTGITPGDDYAAMSFALHKFLSSKLKNDNELPDLIVIDGGKGQINTALGVITELSCNVNKLISMAKGENRTPGKETIYVDDSSSTIEMEVGSPEFNLLIEIRDKAHDYAITSHRRARTKNQTNSFLEKIPGVGPKKRQDLLKYFGGLHGLQDATEVDLVQVPGISKNLAKLIYNELHGDSND